MAKLIITYSPNIPPSPTELVSAIRCNSHHHFGQWHLDHLYIDETDYSGWDFNAEYWPRAGENGAKSRQPDGRNVKDCADGFKKHSVAEAGTIFRRLIALCGGTRQ